MLKFRKCVMEHFPVRSCVQIISLFPTMFKDIAAKIKLEKTKCSCCINYGLVPCSKEQLEKCSII